MSTSTPRYQPAQFVASGWESGTPERKARFVNALLRFIAADCPRERFTRSLYDGLSTHGYFGFIAHYNLDGFYEAQLSTPERHARFLRDLRQDCERDARHDRPDLWSDVKRVLAERLQPQELQAQLRRLPTPQPRRTTSKKPAGPTLF
jgi:hypothetical protein